MELINLRVIEKLSNVEARDLDKLTKNRVVKGFSIHRYKRYKPLTIVFETQNQIPAQRGSSPPREKQESSVEIGRIRSIIIDSK